MIRSVELRELQVFSNASADDLERVAATSAELRLEAGEYAVHEGDPRALFAVLSGKIEVLKSVDGLARTIGWRTPGQVFGEVPIVFGTPFQGSFRAAEPSRVMRVEAAEFHALAARSPASLTALAALARERMGGLQGIALAPARKRATLVGRRGDASCRAVQTFLSRNQISFDCFTLDEIEGTSRWPGPPIADDDLPALHCDDGTTLRRASIREVAARLGLQTTAQAPEYDVVVIGAGPAGLAAGVYGASEGLRTLVIEREAPGGQAETSSRIENYLGFPTGVSGAELARRAFQQANRLGAEIIVTRTALELDAASRSIRLDGGEVVAAKTLVIATGVSWRRLSIDGFDRLLGKGIYYGASPSEARTTQGRDIHLVGAGNSAGQAAMFFANHAHTVTLVVRGSSLEKSMSHYLVEQLRRRPNVHIALRSEIRGVHGSEQLEAVDILTHEDGRVERHASGGVFVFIGADAETSWLPPELARDPLGYLLTGDAVVKATRWPLQTRDPHLLETSLPGIFACGDVRSSPVKRVAAAVGEGSMAIAFVRQVLQHA